LAHVPNERTPSEEWTFSILLAVGVPFRVAFDTLYKNMENENRGTLGELDSSKRLSNIEALVSMMESFVQGTKNGVIEQKNVNHLDLTSSMQRIRMQIQSIPENISRVEMRICALEQEIQRIAC